jgi:hypothetical protein
MKNLKKIRFKERAPCLQWGEPFFIIKGLFFTVTAKG